MAFVVSLLVGACSKPKSHNELTTLFQEQRDKFDRLVEMVKEDSALCAAYHQRELCVVDISAVGEGSKGFISRAYKVGNRTGPKETMTLDRLEQYILLTESIPLQDTNIYFDGKHAVFTGYSFSLLVAHWRTDFVFHPNLPQSELSGEDVPAVFPNGYKKIADDWYLRDFYAEAMP